MKRFCSFVDLSYIVFVYLFHWFNLILCNIFLANYREQAIPAENGTTIITIQVIDRAKEADVVPVITIVSIEFNIAFNVLYILYFCFNFCIFLKYVIISFCC